jgi:hypothetical protein
MECGTGRHVVRALALLGVVLLLTASPAGARPPSGPAVDIHTAALLAPDGSSVTVTVLASCPERSTLVEAVVRVSQPQASGQASFSFPCIGFLRGFTVDVPASVGTFVLGDAGVTASVVSKRGKTQRADDAETVDVQPGVLAELDDTARLDPDGRALTIGVTVACPVGAIPHPSFVGVTQGNTIGSGPYTPICDGAEHRFVVRVEAREGTYRAGEAQALTFANVEHEGIGTAGVDDERIALVS